MLTITPRSSGFDPAAAGSLLLIRRCCHRIGLRKSSGEGQSDDRSGLHMDIMDGYTFAALPLDSFLLPSCRHFVPNLTIGAPLIESLRKHTNAYLDCHLMVTNPIDYVEHMAKAGASGFTFHVEVAKENWQQLVCWDEASCGSKAWNTCRTSLSSAARGGGGVLRRRCILIGIWYLFVSLRVKKLVLNVLKSFRES
ncbi:unnamed protein product [Arabidopsis lyrata]|nr:unnamed protein product [Arabidopsis lyrata]